MKTQHIIFLSAFIICLLFTAYAHAQNGIKEITLSGQVVISDSKQSVPFANVILQKKGDSAIVAALISNEAGRFTIEKIRPGNYQLTISSSGFETYTNNTLVGELSNYLDLGTISLKVQSQTLSAVTITGNNAPAVSNRLDKKTFSMAEQISQSGGSVLQTLKNLPGISIDADGKLQLRGSNKVAILIDGKQTALTGFGSQQGLDNIAASAIDRIEIINNPSSKFDANGNAGIINIIYKKNKQNGFNGKLGLTGGLGSLWERKENLPTIRPQYTLTPKINPSLSLNYRKNNINAFLQADNLYTQTLNKNEFVTRTYNDGTVIQQQTKRNRNTNFFTSKLGMDWNIDQRNTLTISGMFGSEKIIDRGDEPFFDATIKERLRLWQFLEDELKTTVMATAGFQHQFQQPGHVLNAGFNYTFHREDEKYFFDNITPDFTSKDAFKLLSDESVLDFNLDYVRPLRHGRIEAGFKFRHRTIPTDMLFMPGTRSVLDTNAGGWAGYSENIPALYGNYVYENNKWEAELGLRAEYVKLQYDVNPGHIAYESDGYHYIQPFPTVRLAYKLDDNNKLSLFYNRRVDRPNEVDIRIFPKYDDAEIIKVGNPALRPQFTQTLELGYKTNLSKGFFYAAVYHRSSNATITRISTTVDTSKLIYATFQNVNRSYHSGIEMILSGSFRKIVSFNISLDAYRNQINAFTVQNLYPIPHTFSAGTQEMYSGNLKINTTFKLPRSVDLQLSAIYLAPDIIPQGKTGSRFSLDAGLKKNIQRGKGELFVNATDLLNTMVIKKEIKGDTFSYTNRDYSESQVIRLGYSYKF